jgi:TonB-dependent SusC/RagA subfamily outer membrane receptor
MHRHLYPALALLAVACIPAKSRVATTPASSTAARCGEGDSAITYVVDGRPATCASAMGVAADRIASIEVLKGDAAVSLYGPSARAGVVVIQTKR